MGANGNRVDLLGQRFGALCVIGSAPSIRRNTDGYRQAAWLCRCDCGNEIVVRGNWLRAGKKKACGINGHRFSSVEVSSTVPERRVYNGMMQRCYNPKTTGYKYYGAKGVKVCRRWREAFTNFLSDMGPRPGAEFSLDRFPDTTGDYKPTNCRWATNKQQARNKRDSIFVFYGGETINLADFVEKSGINPQMVRRRLRRGWSIEDALLTPSGGHCGSSQFTRNEYPEDWISGDAFKA